jgi:post-segregation antitoxin (ccd killing protein)
MSEIDLTGQPPPSLDEVRAAMKLVPPGGFRGDEKRALNNAQQEAERAAGERLATEAKLRASEAHLRATAAGLTATGHRRLAAEREAADEKARDADAKLSAANLKAIEREVKQKAGERWILAFLKFLDAEKKRGIDPSGAAKAAQRDKLQRLADVLEATCEPDTSRLIHSAAYLTGATSQSLKKDDSPYVRGFRRAVADAIEAADVSKETPKARIAQVFVDTYAREVGFIPTVKADSAFVEALGYAFEYVGLDATNMQKCVRNAVRTLRLQELEALASDTALDTDARVRPGETIADAGSRIAAATAALVELRRQIKKAREDLGLSIE